MAARALAAAGLQDQAVLGQVFSENTGEFPEISIFIPFQEAPVVRRLPMRRPEFRFVHPVPEFRQDVVGDEIIFGVTHDAQTLIPHGITSASPGISKGQH